MGHARLICTHLYIVTHLVEGQIYRFLSSPTDFSTRSHSCSPLQHHSLEKKHCWISAIRFAPNLIHQGASVITEISSARGDKNSASSKQKRSHSWHKVNSIAQQKGQNYTKWPKNCKALYILGAHVRMHVIALYKACICA